MNDDELFGGKDIFWRFDDGTPALVVGHDRSTPEYDGKVLIQVMNGRMWLGHNLAIRVGLALLRYAEARIAADRGARTFPASDTQH